MSAVNVAGSALNVMASTLSANSGSPSMLNMVEYENIASTTLHSSVPRLGLRPARHSSHANIPLACPWYASILCTRRYVLSTSDWLWLARYCTAADFSACALFTTYQSEEHTQFPRR